MVSTATHPPHDASFPRERAPVACWRTITQVMDSSISFALYHRSVPHSGWTIHNHKVTMIQPSLRVSILQPATTQFEEDRVSEAHTDDDLRLTRKLEHTLVVAVPWET